MESSSAIFLLIVTISDANQLFVSVLERMVAESLGEYIAMYSEPPVHSFFEGFGYGQSVYIDTCQIEGTCSLWRLSSDFASFCTVEHSFDSDAINA